MSTLKSLGEYTNQTYTLNCYCIGQAKLNAINRCRTLGGGSIDKSRNVNVNGIGEDWELS